MADFYSKARGLLEDLKDQEMTYRAYLGNPNVNPADIKGVVGEMRKLRDQLNTLIDGLRDDFTKAKLGSPHIPKVFLRHQAHRDGQGGGMMSNRPRRFESPFNVPRGGPYSDRGNQNWGQGGGRPNGPPDGRPNMNPGQGQGQGPNPGKGPWQGGQGQGNQPGPRSQGPPDDSPTNYYNDYSADYSPDNYSDWYDTLEDY
jgi:hypothetical protein